MKIGRLLIVILSTAGFLFSAVFSLGELALYSSTRSFSLDGHRYTIVPSEESDFSLVRQELKKSGINLPIQWDETPKPNPTFSYAISGEGKERTFPRIPIPSSFDIDHTLRLSNEAGGVEIMFGSTHGSPLESTNLLRRIGWSCSMTLCRNRKGTIATYSRGKEKFLAFLEMEGNGFLLIHQIVR